ncbi:MAG: hypothetical protein ACRDI1_05035, partial [Actinomycetota bacterium]
GEFTEEAFREVLGDTSLPDRAKRILLCQGKVFYDLARHRDEKEVEGASLVRIEQLYPLRLDLLRETASAAEGAEIYWVQEEPENMGAWTFVDHHLRRELGWEMTLVAREESASPATGSNRLHQAEQQELVERAFEGL